MPAHHGYGLRANAGAFGLVLLAGGMTLGACGGGDTLAEKRAARAERGRGDIVVAVAWPWAAHAEVRFGDGLELALAETNDAGGIGGRKLRLVRYDDEESVDKGRIVAQRIVADPEVVAVIGHLQSHVSVPAAPIYDLGGVLMIAPAATDPELTVHGYRSVFRATFTDRAVGRSMAEFAMSRGYRRIAICYLRNAYGRDLANAFEERATELGAEIRGRQSYDASGGSTGTAFQSILRGWADLELDAIFLAGEVPSAGAFIAQARRQGIRIPIIGGDAMSSPALLSAAGPAAEGTIVASPFHPDDPRPEVRDFTAAFAKRFGAPPDVGAALGYDVLRLLADAMRRAGSTVPERVALAMRSTQQWRGVTGAFSFDSAGDPIDKPVVKMIVQGGRFEYLAETGRTALATPGVSPPLHGTRP